MRKSPSTLLIDRVVKHLTEYCQMKQLTTTEDLFAVDATGFLLNPKVRIAHHFDPVIDILIYDGRLGSLGIVRLLSENEATDEIHEAIRLCVDQATYIRHLLISSCPEHEFPPTVELILIPQNATGSEIIGTALQLIAKKTGYLHAINVNILTPTKIRNDFELRDLRRAFAWLLPNTAAWNKSMPKLKPASGQNTPVPPSLTAIELNNYRLPGTRTIILAPKAAVHLIHGHNGSGKSSLAEALELVVTGKADRLKGSQDYTKVVSNSRRAKGKSATSITINMNGKQQNFKIVPKGVASPLAKDLPVASFRLDQPLMDRLSRLGPGERASVFLDAFFPKNRAILDEFQLATINAHRSLASLPDDVRQKLPSLTEADRSVLSQAALARFSWLADQDADLSPTVLNDCLPLPMEDLLILRSVRPEFELIAQWGEKQPTLGDLKGDLDRLDRGLDAIVRDKDIHVTLSRAIACLHDQANWLASGSERGNDNFTDTLNAWLEHVALVDLTEKRYQVEKTFLDAEQSGWRPESVTEAESMVISSTQAIEATAKIQQDIATYTSKRDELYARLKSMEVTASQANMAKETPLKKLGSADIRALNITGEWFRQHAEIAEASSSLLGDALQTAHSKDIPLRFGQIELGRPQWSEPLLDHLTKINEVYQQLVNQKNADSFFNCSRRYELLHKARIAQLEYLAKKLDIQGTLLGHMKKGKGNKYNKLIDALNELMALFTPARWAYEEIGLPLRTEKDGKHSLDFTSGTGGADAELRLNTAELNLFTTALFLLFAPLQQNPLHLLILDDPLQNMDELTVSSVAKGLAKIVRLWQHLGTEPWQLIFLFHGEEDLERFRREVPAALYHLPWLTPGSQDEPPAITIDNQTPEKMLQGIQYLPKDLFNPLHP